MTNENDVPKRVYLVERTVVESYFALGHTQAEASDAVYWLISSGRPMRDAVYADTARSERVSWESGLAQQLCPNCPHFVSHHPFGSTCYFCPCDSTTAVPVSGVEQEVEP